MTFKELHEKWYDLRLQTDVYIIRGHGYNEKTIFKGEFYKMPRIIAKHYSVSFFYMNSNKSLTIHIVPNQETVSMWTKHFSHGYGRWFRGCE